MASFFTELSLVLLITFCISVIVSRLRQPLIIGYLLSGIIVSPIFLDILVEKDSFLAFSHIGISFLLFLVGLQLDVKLIRTVGKPSMLTGFGQILATILLTLAATGLLGFSLQTALIFAVGLSFSSTIVIVKLLSDSGDLQKYYGQVSLGFLLIQDFAAAIILLTLSTPIKAGGLLSRQAGIELAQLALGIAVLVFTLQKTIPRLLNYIKHHDELMFLFTVSWCFAFAALFQQLGFSLEVGALLSGILIAHYPVHERISQKIMALRDFFLIIFFMFLGYELMPEIANVPLTINERMGIAAGVFQQVLPLALLLSTIVLIGNPLIVYSILRKLGHNRRTSLYSGLTVSQISEFSIIIFLLAQDAEILTQKETTTITVVALMTIVASTYMYTHKEKILEKTGKHLW